jgi:histidyl-tRNA synthetase
MTPTLARMLAKVHKQVLKPIKWFSQSVCMRFEKPQRGRLREFYQLNVDVFGGNELDEDIEILRTVFELLRSYDAPESSFIIKLSHRECISRILFNLFPNSKENLREICRLIDKKDKIPRESFDKALSELGLGKEDINTLRELFKMSLRELKERFLEVSTYLAQIEDLISVLKTLYPKINIEHDLSIMRGFDYYTGMIFEVYDVHPDNTRAMFGGGRYDNLIESFDAEKLSGVGFGMGDVTLFNFLDSHSLIPEFQREIDVCIGRFGENDRTLAFLLSQRLLKLGLNVHSQITNLGFGKQIQHAVKLKAKAFVFQGGEDIESKTFQVKWLYSGQQEQFSYDDIGLESFYKKIQR